MEINEGQTLMFSIYSVAEKITDNICCERDIILKAKALLGISLWKARKMFFNECEVIFQGETIL